jgi:hemolysin III
MARTISEYSPIEELLHASTHGIGVVLSIAGLAVLVAFAAMNGNGWHVVSSSIYGATLVLMYSASTLYHGVWHQRAKALLQKIDHAAIYLLIAGTYTPFMLVNLREQGGWILFSVVWFLAVTGVILEMTGWRPFKRISLGIYLGMGWLVLFVFKPLVEQVSTGGLVLLVLGGLAYSLGALFYIQKGRKYHHAIWHLFVLAGSVLHYFAVLFYVIP